MRDLIGASQSVVDAPYDIGHGIYRIERLVRIHLPGGIGIGGDLPPGQIDRLQTGLDLLHGLITGEGAERRHERLGLQQVTQSQSAHFCYCVPNVKRAGQPLDLGRLVIPANI
jgi:hypothetical protein